jgi:multidrug resistance efflux pump
MNIRLTVWSFSKFALVWVGVAGLVASVPVASAQKVAAVARIVPAHGLIELDGPAGDAVSQVLVAEGDAVAAGTALLDLQSGLLAEAELAQAEAARTEARAQKPLALRQAEIAVKQAEAEAELALRTLKRSEAGELQKLAEQVFDEREHAVQVTGLRLVAARGSLEAMQAAQAAALGRTDAAWRAAQARVVRSRVTAPTAGTILQIDVQPGESTGRGRPLVTMADLTAMAVVADVFEGDLAPLKIGQRAVITSRSLSAPVAGRVTHIGRLIAGAGKTGRVTVTLDDATVASRLINAEVDLTIDL